MGTMTKVHVAVATACALGLASMTAAQDLGDFAMSLATPDPAAPAAPAKVAQAATPQTGMPRGATKGTMPRDANAPSTATTPDAARSTAAAKLPSSDRKFLEAAAKGGMAEVALGKLAQEHGASDQVKQFAGRMVEDHGKANDELKRIAQSKGMTLPADMDARETRTLHRLQKLSGADFDRAYMKEMLSDHKKDVREFKSKARDARDADVKSFAETTLPTLQQHLDLAQSVEAGTRSVHANRARPSATRGPGLPPPPSTGV